MFCKRFVVWMKTNYSFKKKKFFLNIATVPPNDIVQYKIHFKDELCSAHLKIFRNEYPIYFVVISSLSLHQTVLFYKS